MGRRWPCTGEYRAKRRTKLKRAYLSLGGRSTVVLGDVRVPADVERMGGEIEEQLGPIDILVNNAVHALCKPFPDYTVDEWREQLAYKGLGYYLTVRQMLPRMLER